VSLNFIASDSLKSSKSKPLERLRLEFDIDNNDQLVLNNADRETQRTVIDIASLIWYVGIHFVNKYLKMPLELLTQLPIALISEFVDEYTNPLSKMASQLSYMVNIKLR
jgi:hypothetical protein